MRSALSFFFFSPANTIFVPKQRVKVRTQSHDRQGTITWDVFLRVCEIHVQCVLCPDDALVFVGLGVGEASSLASFPSEHSMEVGSLLVFPASLYSVALGTGLGEDLLAVISAHD